MQNQVIKYKLIYNGQDYSPIPNSVDITNLAELENFVEIYNEDDEPIKIVECSFKDNLTNILVNFLDSFDENELKSLLKNIDEKDEDYSEKKKLYSATSDKKWFGGLIGFLRKQNFTYNNEYEFDITLRCRTRFDDEKKGYFLCSMLLNSDLSFVDSLIPVDDNDDIFDYMLLLRYIYLLRESYIKGFYKKYITFQGNDDHLKGSIDIARHLQLNCGYDNGKIAYSYRENTVKNPLNMLIIKTCEVLKNKFFELMDVCFTREDEDIIDTLNSEIGFIDYSIPELIKLNSKPICHPYFFEYESLREICLKILRDEGMNLYSQEEVSEANGFLLYVPNLWEKYLEEHFRLFNDNMLNVKLQDSHDIAYLESNDKSMLNIRPDFVFYKNGSPCMMLDAKFIPKWKTAIKNNTFSEVSDDFNKCIRDMACLEIHKTGVIFPVKGEEIFEKYKITINRNDLFIAMGVKIPKIEEGKNFYEWNRTFENSVKDQINELKPIYNDN